MGPETLEHTVDVDGRTYQVELEPQPEGGFVATVHDCPGCLTEGDTVDDTLENVQDAIRVWQEAADRIS